MVDSGGIRVIPKKLTCSTGRPLLEAALAAYADHSTPLKLGTELGEISVWPVAVNLQLAGLIEVDPDRGATTSRQHRLDGIAQVPWTVADERVGVLVTFADNACTGTVQLGNRPWEPQVSS